MKELPQHDKEQRDLPVAALKAIEHTHMNSQFQKSENKKVTRADWSATRPPYVPTRYAEIDAVLANKRTTNMVRNVESDTKTYLTSDRFRVNVRIKIKLAKNKDKVKDESNA